MEMRFAGSGGGTQRNDLNVLPGKFQAGLSNKFTKRHVTNFEDTTLMAASAAKLRAEKKMERQALAIEKQQEKIESEMKKIEEITQRLHRQQMREANRIRNRLQFAAMCIQTAYRHHRVRRHIQQTQAATEIQRHWRAMLARQCVWDLRQERYKQQANAASAIITRILRRYVCRLLLRHELQWRTYAAIVIQCVLRQYQAKLLLQSLRQERHVKQTREHAAIQIQSRVRSRLTRVVYLDVLYLVSRIQAVMRGFLVRKRLRWLLAINLHAIVRFQAHVRGYFERKSVRNWVEQQRKAKVELEEQSRRHQPQRGRSLRQMGTASPAVVPTESITEGAQHRRRSGIQQGDPSARPSLPSTTLMAPSPANPPIKRSYWLPAGSNTVAKRLPHLPIRQTTTITPDKESVESLNVGVVVVGALNARKLRTKFHAMRHPARLDPIDTGTSDPKGRISPANDTDCVEVEDDAVRQLSRQQREEELKKKLLTRRIQERRRLELVMKVRLDEEHEAMERKLMEREEKLVRLHLKTTHRRHHEQRLKRQTLEQQREERERMEMMREERLMRLHRKFLLRPTMTLETVPYVKNLSDQSEEEEEELQRERHHHLVRPRRKGSRTVQNEVQPCQIQHNPRIKKANKTIKHKKSRGGNNSGNQERGNNVNSIFSIPYVVEDTAEFDYGDEFEDVVDESMLGRLIC